MPLSHTHLDRCGDESLCIGHSMKFNRFHRNIILVWQLFLAQLTKVVAVRSGHDEKRKI